MTRIPDALKPHVAQAAHALKGHLELLASLGVTGLPAATVTASAAPPAPKKDPPPVATPVQVTPPPPPPPPPPAPRAVPPVRSGGMPWDRHMAGTPEDPPPAVEAPKAAVLPVVIEKQGPVPPPVTVAAAPPPAVVRGAPGLKIIRDDLGDCRRCKLWTGRTNLVFGVGNPQAEVCFVGEGPGADEDIQGEPFVGKAGQLLTQMIKGMGLAREDVYICNVVKCRPPNNREPEPDEIGSCSPYLERQIHSVNPKVLVALGRTAAQSLLRSKVSITKIRGTWHEFDGIPVMPTFHPSYLLRDPTQKRPAWEDLKSVLQKLGRPVPEPRKPA